VAANSRGFVGGYPFSRHTISVAPIAGKGANMQRDDWYSSMRDPKQLARPEAIGRYAAERALARLNACKLTTRKCPVLFEAPLAAGLLGAFVQAVSGGALYRKSTFLLDSLGQQVFPDHIQVREDPHVIGGVGSARSMKKASRRGNAMWSATAWCRVTSCRPIRRASWAWKPPAIRVVRTICR